MTRDSTSFGRRGFIKGVGAAGIVGLSGCSSNGGNGGNGDTTTTGTTVGDSGNDITVLHFTDSWVPKGQLAPIYHAIDAGMFADRNLSVQTSRGYGSGETAKAVGTGKTDIGFAGSTATASVIKQGLDNVVWASPLQPNTVAGVYVGPDVDITELEDIEGKDGVYDPGNVSWVVGQAVFDQENIDISGVDWDVTFSGPQLLFNGNVDFMLQWTSDVPMFWYGDDTYEPRILMFRDYTKVFGNGFITTEEYLEENREVVSSFLDAVYESYIDTYQEGEQGIEAALDSLFKYYGEMATGQGSREFHRANLQLWLSLLLTDSVQENGLGYLDSEGAESSVEVINNYVLEDSITADELMALDDPLVAAGDYTIPNFEDHTQRLQTIQPGGFDNPLL